MEDTDSESLKGMTSVNIYIYMDQKVLIQWHNDSSSDTHAENPTTQMQDSGLSHLLLLWTPHLEFTPTRP